MNIVLRAEKKLFRKGSDANSDMYAEAFHRVLKSVYLRGNKTGVDELLKILLEVACDKAHEQFIK